MTTLTIRGLDEETRARLRIRAAHHGRSMEAEVRAILREALVPRAKSVGLGSRIHSRFAALGDAEIDLPARNDVPRAAEFET
ncbi:MAG TPA: Arc family DNA-binding protein [Streptosporangiaceae bacterium]|nr:Arc family DNA-binding protein [Streptosporangiaceae bacterium]